MSILYSGNIHSNFYQGYLTVEGGPGDEGIDRCFAGQSNGLIGAAAPGFIFLSFGVHTGWVGLTVELANAPPPLDDTWEEIVEAPWKVTAPIDLRLVDWNGSVLAQHEMPAGEYRVRYAALHFAKADEIFEPHTELNPAGEVYQLWIWPAPHAPDAIVKVTSEIANWWHMTVQRKALINP